MDVISDCVFAGACRKERGREVDHKDEGVIGDWVDDKKEERRQNRRGEEGDSWRRREGLKREE